MTFKQMNTQLQWLGSELGFLPIEYGTQETYYK